MVMNFGFSDSRRTLVKVFQNNPVAWEVVFVEMKQMNTLKDN
jgi:hypothetical protein